MSPAGFKLKPVLHLSKVAPPQLNYTPKGKNQLFTMNILKYRQKPIVGGLKSVKYVKNLSYAHGWSEERKIRQKSIVDMNNQRK